MLLIMENVKILNISDTNALKFHSNENTQYLHGLKRNRSNLGKSPKNKYRYNTADINKFKQNLIALI